MRSSATALVVSVLVLLLVPGSVDAIPVDGDWKSCGVVVKRSSRLVLIDRALAASGIVGCRDARSLVRRWHRSGALVEKEWSDGWRCEYGGRPWRYETRCRNDRELLVRIQYVSARSLRQRLTLARAETRTIRVMREQLGGGAAYEARVRCTRLSRYAARCRFTSFAGDISWRGHVRIVNRAERWDWTLTGVRTDEYHGDSKALNASGSH